MISNSDMHDSLAHARSILLDILCDERFDGKVVNIPIPKICRDLQSAINDLPPWDDDESNEELPLFLREVAE